MAAEVCPGGRPSQLAPASTAASAIFARVARAAGTRVALGVSGEVNGACIAPAGVFHAAGWLAEEDLMGDAPATVLYAWLLASHSALYRRGVGAAADSDFVAGCTIARLGVTGDALARHAATLVERTSAVGASGAERASRRAAVARGARACR